MIRRPLACLALCLATLCAATAEAQRIGARSLSPAPSEIFRSFAQMTVVSGRIVNMNWQRVGMGSQSFRNDQTKEEVHWQCNNVVSTFHFERTSKEDPLLVDFSSDGSFSIRREGTDKSMPAVQFVQGPAGPIALSVGPLGKEKVYRALGLWHLAIGYPNQCKQDLFPLLEKLPGCTQLSQTAALIEADLLRAAVAGKLPDRRHWAVLVRQLGDNQFAKREAADRLLRAIGPPVAGYLQQLEYGQLDAEQQYRVRRIIDSLHGPATADSPEHVADRLVADSSVWLALLGRPEASTRRTAAKHLAGLLGEPIGVDPEADPATQEKQREQLRVKLEPPKAETKTSP
jgi:hypothetical protein